MDSSPIFVGGGVKFGRGLKYPGKSRNTSWTQRLKYSVKWWRFLSIIIIGLDILFISEILAKCGDWHDLFYFIIDPNGGFWYFGVVVVLPVNEHANTLTLYFWGIYEMDFREVSNSKAPGGFNIPLEPFLSHFLQHIKIFGAQKKEVEKCIYLTLVHSGRIRWF